MSFEFTFSDGPAFNRRCGDCQLCCKLLPVKSINKPASTRCKHQRHGKGCGVYHTPNMPRDCKLWSCRWLVDEDTAGLNRPDRTHYVIDIMPDYVTAQDNETGAETTIPVLQIWCDPDYPDAHRDPDLRAYLLEMGKQGYCAIIRYGSAEGIFIAPPNIAHDGQWHEKGSMIREAEHTMADKLRAMG